MDKRIKILFAMVCLLSTSTYAQLVNDGDALTLSNNSLIHVDAEFINSGGKILNNGTLEVKGDFTNSNLSSIVFDNLSTGVVELSGNTPQQITGSRITFPSLSLLGTAKKVLNTDIDISGVFALGNKEFDIKSHTVHVTNADTGAVVRGNDVVTAGTGFISTDYNGALIRNTNLDSAYLFPLGSTKSNAGLTGVTTLYRPLRIKPLDAFANAISASLINNDPTIDSYDKTKKRYDVKSVSDKYYYLLDQKAGTSSFNVTFYQNSAVDNTYTQLVNWGDYLQWEKAAPSTVASGAFGDDLNGSALNTSIKFTTLKAIHNSAYTFSSDAGGVNPFTFYNAFSPDGDNKNDTWIIHNIDLFPDNKLTIFNRWGDEVFSMKGYTNDKAWDGGGLQSGTYYYVLTTTIESQSRAFKGFITMIKKN
jgi:gliding motility-associated-like protein